MEYITFFIDALTLFETYVGRKPVRVQLNPALFQEIKHQIIHKYGTYREWESVQPLITGQQFYLFGISFESEICEKFSISVKFLQRAFECMYI